MASPVASSLKKVVSPRTSPSRYLRNCQNLPKVQNFNRIPTSPHLAFQKQLIKPNIPQVHKKPVISVPLVHINNKTVLSVNSSEIDQIEYSTISNDDYYILGKGSFGIVILAEYKGEIVAAKVVSRSTTIGKISFRNELNLMKLTHPNIVKVIKIMRSEKTGVGFVLMEPMPATNLQKVISTNYSIPLKDKMRYLLNISEAIMHCHMNKILHLDVKPKNILVNEITKVCKLCDFGNSLDISEGSLTGQWVHRGTVIYSSPELLKGKCPTEKCDVYSLGITMWQLLHEETPFCDLPTGCLIYKVVSANTRPQSNKKVIKNEFKKMYEKFWNSNPNLRPAMFDIVKYFEKILAECSLPAFEILS